MGALGSSCHHSLVFDLLQMNKKVKKLEKESAMYKQRYENTNRALLEMVEQKQQHEKIIDMQVSSADSSFVATNTRAHNSQLLAVN